MTPFLKDMMKRALDILTRIVVAAIAFKVSFLIGMIVCAVLVIDYNDRW